MMLPSSRARERGQFSDCRLLGSLASDGPGHDASAPLVLQPVALAGDLHHGRVVQDAVEHCSGEHGIACERLVPAAEGQVGGEDQ
jgi:hypothetical protein